MSLTQSQIERLIKTNDKITIIRKSHSKSDVWLRFGKIKVDGVIQFLNSNSIRFRFIFNLLIRIRFSNRIRIEFFRISNRIQMYCIVQKNWHSTFTISNYKKLSKII